MASVHPDPVKDRVEPGVGSLYVGVRRVTTIDIDQDAEATVIRFVGKTHGHATTVGASIERS
jgi:Arc/MetJ family transcription regulator